MALTKFDICSQALIKCGADTISSFTDGTHESNVCSVMYDTIKKSLLYYTFWNFAIISTLVVAFFPFSLLFCVIFYGLEQTKFLIAALLHDAIKTFLAVLSVVLSIIIVVVVIFILLAQG